MDKINQFKPPKGWLKIQTIDAHTGGEPLRIITDGYPELKSKTLLGKRREAEEKYDNIRKAIILEPRGHVDMYGAIIVKPDTPGADFGVIFIHNEGYSTGCGHAVLALTKVFVEMGLVQKIEPETKVKMDVPSGLIRSYASIEHGKVKNIHFQNVPSFVQALDAEIDVVGLGKVKYDLAFGGAFYAFVDINRLGLDFSKNNCNQLIEEGMRIKQAISDKVKMVHPNKPDMNFLYGTIFIDFSKTSNNHSRNVCIFADGELDRSPTGTGVSARAAIHFARGDIKLNESIIIESIIGSTFSVKVVDTIEVGKYSAVIPEISGNAFITGRNTFWIDPKDSLGKGFILR